VADLILFPELALSGYPPEDAGRFNAVSWIPGPASIAKTAGAELLLIPDWLWATALFMVICVAVFHRLKTD